MTASDGSPRLVCAGMPVDADDVAEIEVDVPGPILDTSSWIRPERSTRSRKTSFPMSRRAMTRPPRLASLAGLLPGLDLSASARTAEISSRSGKRFGSAMGRESKRMQD